MAAEIPSIEIDHLETPPISPVNFCGAGEGGAICAPPAIVNAVSDYIGGFFPHVVRKKQMPQK